MLGWVLGGWLGVWWLVVGLWVGLGDRLGVGWWVVGFGGLVGLWLGGGLGWVVGCKL